MRALTALKNVIIFVEAYSDEAAYIEDLRQAMTEKLSVFNLSHPSSAKVCMYYEAISWASTYRQGDSLTRDWKVFRPLCEELEAKLLGAGDKAASEEQHELVELTPAET